MLKRVSLLLISALFLTACSHTTGTSDATAHEEYYIVNGDAVTIFEENSCPTGEDPHISVALTHTDGPTECKVTLFYKEDSESAWIDGGSETVVLGEDPCIFHVPQKSALKVAATATSGRNGYATLQISLT